MSTRKLDLSYAASLVQFAAHDYARRAATRSTTTSEMLQQLGLSSLIGEVSKNRRKRILEHFEAVSRQMRRQCFLDLVLSFESDLFKLISTATSKVRHTLNQHYGSDYPFAGSLDVLARTPSDFSNLGGYRRLLARQKVSDHDPRQPLWDIVSHRDFLAHGQRWAPMAIPPTIDSAYAVLSGELDRATGRPST